MWPRYQGFLHQLNAPFYITTRKHQKVHTIDIILGMYCMWKYTDQVYSCQASNQHLWFFIMACLNKFTTSDIIMRMHRCVRDDSELHETVLLDCTTSKAGVQSSNTSWVHFTIIVMMLLLCCYDCDSTQQHYDSTEIEYILWHHTMHE